MTIRHYVIFYSPGTFFAETSIYRIGSLDVEKAISMSQSIRERHGATPYAFQFKTTGLKRIRSRYSPMYFLGGKIRTLKSIKRKNDPDERILTSNMECNGWNEVIENRNSYKITLPFEEDCVLIEM